MDSVILADLASAFGFVPENMIPVSGGWLNEKWRATDGRRDVLIKQLSLTRYSEKGIYEIEAALKRQKLLKDIPCPGLWQSGENIIRRPNEKTAYLVMDFCEGYEVSRESITAAQLKDLGHVLGRIHRQMDDFSSLKTVKGYPLSGEKLLESLHRIQEERTDALCDEDSQAYRQALEDWGKILEGLTVEKLDSLPRGVGHEDFTPDNMLFHDKGVAAILDFDRNQYGFRYHDVGRSLLSLSLMETGLDPVRVRTFMEGYGSEYPFGDSQLMDVLLATWCIEAPWWINPRTFDSDSPKIRRFVAEILWLTEECLKRKK